MDVDSDNPFLESIFLSYFPVFLDILPDMQILGFSGSAANKAMISKLWTYGDTII